MSAILYIIACLLALAAFVVYHLRKEKVESEANFSGSCELEPEAPAAAPRFSGILTARPTGMDYRTYRILRREQNQRLRSYLKHGTLVYLASELYQVGGDMYKRTYLPFVGSTKALKLGEVLCSKRKKEAKAL